MDLTTQEKKAWDFILYYWENHNLYPTFNEVGVALGFTKKFARQYAEYHLRKLEEKGKIKLSGGQRGIVIN